MLPYLYVYDACKLLVFGVSPTGGGGGTRVGGKFLLGGAGVRSCPVAIAWPEEDAPEEAEEAFRKAAIEALTRR